MTQTEIRIDGCNKRIEKIYAKITRLEGLIEKKKAKIESGKGTPTGNGGFWETWDIEHHLDDIESAKKDLAREQKKLEEYKAKRKAEKDKEDSIPSVPVVEEFLENWRINAEEYYRKEIDELLKWKAEYKVYYDKQEKILEAEFGCYKVHYSSNDKEVEARRKELKIDWKYKKTYIASRWTMDVVMLASFKGEELEARLNKMLNDEVYRKRIDLYTRCSAVVGVITDARGLRIGSNKSINGIIVGERGKAKVETIYAGGYNIQCLHYRVLVNEIKPKK